MSKYATTEITSAEIPSDNPVHQRLYFPYTEAAKIIHGNVLELGCGWGRGVETLIEKCDHYTGLDKNEPLIEQLQAAHPRHTFRTADLPHLSAFKDSTFDFVVTFQVIEHIQDDHQFLAEAARVLKPGGKILLTTVNRPYSLSRNPWHIREYDTAELRGLMQKYFSKVETFGVGGNQKVWDYYEENKRSVNKIMRFDIFDLQHRLPAWVLRIPYEVLNRFNRNKLMSETGGLAAEIRWDDHYLSDEPEKCIDFFFVGTK
ncbi:bifunctional 2-polyprenyl-6-hydroxyphenol methylase/3-demethylubiquinol 3-O-methyltransferase UbiG [Emticicia sp. 21SJ11W-3]|uniref:class I SAM-dependent methyltransferase n=1 Tax=Emticicia sp. 21SJ11W-3 TaxID=2916755 RepID=UPI00209F23A5|nr:class I SAM-dependent methyltransferase [Emticicia sp. 21SJ11W-3]UTA66251.1 class I SAM-dependent methyltransferase [Emticicia sp. 21SJ11W-3]